MHVAYLMNDYNIQTQKVTISFIKLQPPPERERERGSKGGGGSERVGKGVRKDKLWKAEPIIQTKTYKHDQLLYHSTLF